MLERQGSRGVTFALRFMVGGHRHYITLGGVEDGWTRRSAEEELERTLAAIKLGVWKPPRPEPVAAEPEPEPSFHELASAPADRTEVDPVVIAGGHAAFNPEPIADFIDAAVLGDGEEAVLEITEIVRGFKAEGSPGGRDELLLRLARTEAVYVPRFYDVGVAARRADPAASRPTGPGYRTGSASAPRWISTRGPTRASRWYRWPRRCTSGTRWRCSGAVPAAAGSARPA